MTPFQTILVALLIIGFVLVGMKFNLFPEGMYGKKKKPVVYKAQKEEVIDVYLPKRKDE